MAKRLVMKVGEYTNDQGETKGEYVRLGVILSGENGEYALIDPTVNLAGCLLKQRVMNAGKQNKGKGDMVMCSIFTDEAQSQSPQSQPAQPAPSGSGFDDFDDNIPF